MKTPRIATYGILLAVGMLLFSGLAVGAFQHIFFVAVCVWIPVLVLLGFLTRRRLLPRPTDAFAVVGFGFLFSSLVMFGIGAFTGSEDILNSIWNIGRMITSIYGLWFWLPFTTGIVLGGFRSIQQAEQPAHGDADESV
jgi:hypothetical protein